ncbi:protein serine/threonine kinase, putative [Entamoeba invadens IP1]|uniref:Protein serine/threonine kinase, putative n=1 Tax=Entamoeba invadens IP1 TaxID=370355 RepID=L7FL74_ENTIV|nr:protein serine/threonine kinase, putative [Entamoeba invadens IP1]ELP86806.1 protein serine/threonine kinase, putative [Entamoeba invadens IP1]|eukprot:XP_004253577.1 protein serine/threonine kinase, putative [Entamoeba invadens IP1]
MLLIMDNAQQTKTVKQRMGLIVLNVIKENSTPIVVHAVMSIVYYDGMCQLTIDTSIYDYNDVIYCKDGYYIDNSECKSCSTNNANWMKCDVEKPMKCSTNYEITESGSCESTTCKNNEETEQNGRCSVTQDNCAFTLNNKCVECTNNYTIDDNGNCIQNNGEIEQSYCKETTQYGCVRCNDKYYLLFGKCVSCDDNCDACISNSTFCLSCKEGTFLSDHKCITNNVLNGICTQFIPSGGCVKCNDGYYRSGLSCEKCDVKCGTCNNRESCLTCNLTNYRTSNNECKPQSDIVGCQLETTQNGCSKCSDGCFTVNTNECEKCNATCATCVQTKYACTSCDTNEVLVDSQCVDISFITNCKEVGYSKCTKCSFWHTPSANGTYCNSHVVWWVILIGVLLIIVIFIVTTLVIVLIVKHVSKYLKEKSNETTTTLFEMSKSNIQFVTVGDGVVVNKTKIVFNDGEEVEVNEKQRDLLCVGNITKHNMKIQISTQTLTNQKYQIESNPQIVVLPKGFACEFEILLTLSCTSKIESKILLVANSYTQQKAICKAIGISALSKISIRIDPDELIEGVKIGEGSFGIVYKGNYRGNVVVIKKMKSAQENVMDEFTKEVSMLDKFRSEYIVHFYGAVFIPSKVCMVTEYAQYGSLKDLMSHKNSNEIDFQIRNKMMIDAAKGILYLHSNGILHRDIKPDNILVFSLDVNDKVNAKLTDFGASRNINMLMTNMTFTKGIGTPKYMAPEVLNKEKYKKAADVYSFAITMYECFTWSDAFPKDVYKYAWDIADSVCYGKRPDLMMLTEKQKDVVVKAWQQTPKDRPDIETVIKQLESL